VKGSLYTSFVKPIADVVMAFVVFAAILPLFALIALLLAGDVGNPFFTQQRVGKGLRVFRIIKFRTMTNKKDEKGNLLPDAQRLTAIGRIIRKTSLDEIPQLINVMKGDMSFIGPRPLVTEYVPIYSAEQVRRHEVKPGISGWAQINGRNAISWGEKFKHDIWYVEHISLLVDLKILLITIVKVLRAEGISGRGVATAEFFNGKN
jgi:lipopolysaccharide/colanic/teichoic acid biosynthesis glycosyltransferase